MPSKEPAKNPGTLSQLLLSCLTSLTDVLAFCTSFSDMYMLAFCHGGLSVPHKKTLQSQCSWLICLEDHDHDSADLSGNYQIAFGDHLAFTSANAAHAVAAVFYTLIWALSLVAMSAAVLP